MNRTTLESAMRNRILFLLEEDDPYFVEIAGMAGQMIRCGFEDPELFARIRDEIEGSDFDLDAPEEAVNGLTVAVSVALGLLPNLALSPQVDEELKYLDLEICAAKFLGLESRAKVLEDNARLQILMLPSFYGQSVFQEFAETYAKSIGMEPEQVPILQAIQETRGMSKPEETECVNPLGQSLNLNRFFKSQSKMIH